MKNSNMCSVQAGVSKEPEVDREVERISEAILVNTEMIRELRFMLSVPKPMSEDEKVDHARYTVSEVLRGASEQIEENNDMLRGLLDEVKEQIGNIKLLR